MRLLYALVALLGFFIDVACAQSFSDPTPVPDSSVTEAPAMVSIKITPDEGYRLESARLFIAGCPQTFAQDSPAVTFVDDLFTVDLQAGNCALPPGRVDVIAMAQEITTETPYTAQVNTFSWSFTIQGPPAGLQFSDLQPARDSQISSTKPTISVRVVSSSGSIRRASLEILLSACPGLVFKVGAGATYSPDGVLTLDLAQTSCNLPKGQVTVTVNAAATSGAEQSFSWGFTVGDAPLGAGALMLGDLDSDGQITEQDFEILKAFLRPRQGESETTLTPDQEKAADLRRPCGRVTAKDLKLLRRAVKLAARGKTLPVTECYKDKRVGDLVDTGAASSLLSRALVVRELAQVQLYTLAGDKLFDDELSMPSSPLITQRAPGLATGVYLAVVTIQRSDGLSVRRVEKILVRR